MKEVDFLNLRCRDGCGAPLVIVADDIAECEYCNRVYKIIDKGEELRDWQDGPWDPYFLDPDKCCQECKHWGRNWCRYWDMRAHPDQLCDHFVQFADYFCKGGERMTAYPYATKENYHYGIVYPD